MTFRQEVKNWLKTGSLEELEDSILEWQDKEEREFDEHYQMAVFDLTTGEAMQ